MEDKHLSSRCQLVEWKVHIGLSVRHYGFWGCLWFIHWAKQSAFIALAQYKSMSYGNAIILIL